MNWKSIAAAFFTFSRKDRLGAFVLALLIMLVYALPYMTPEKNQPPIILDDTLKTWLDSSGEVQVAGYSRTNESFDYTPSPSTRKPDFEKGALFSFDPNTLDAAGWERLGLGSRTIRTIINYRNKGGKFYQKEDLKKIWGLPNGFYQRVGAYINIEHIKYNKRIATSLQKTTTTSEFTYKKIDINTADTSDWKALPGVGPKLASRIVNFRSKLGGFISIEQVGTTYGLPDSTFQIIKYKLEVSNKILNKIKINTATKEELSAHPYISWELAKSIVSYRQQHGAIKSETDLKNLMILGEKNMEQLLPYLQFD